jgi:hypothetical protein
MLKEEFLELLDISNYRLAKPNSVVAAIAVYRDGSHNTNTI